MSVSGRQLLAGVRNLWESQCKAVASPRPEHNAAGALSRKAAVTVELGFVAPKTAVRQLSNGFGVHGLNEGERRLLHNGKYSRCHGK
jgi:hypothetical protein